MIRSASLLLASSICAGAWATTVDVQEIGMGACEVVSILSPGYSGGVYSGQQVLNVTNSSNTSAFANGSYLVYCGDVYQFSPGGPSPYSVVAIDLIPNAAPMGAAKAAAIADLYAFANGAQFSANAAYACAFQLAVWETITDFGGPLGVGSGAFQATGYSGAAGVYLANLLAAVGSGGSANLVGLQSPSYQDYIVEVSGNVPGPGSLALVGMGGLLTMRRRRA
ncbi:MAG: hypothetical protein K8R92_01030 [Planctomycetes bacterium]|nr:hypothetical protein [Planctomycetota bacterium]